MMTFFRPDLLWGYVAVHPRRYRAGSITVVLFPPDVPAFMRRMLFLHRFRAPLSVLLFAATSVVGATIVLVEAAAVVALAVAVSTADALHRVTRNVRTRLATVEVRPPDEQAMSDERRRLVDEFLEAAHRRPRPADPAHLHRLWRDLYRDLRAAERRD